MAHHTSNEGFLRHRSLRWVFTKTRPSGKPYSYITLSVHYIPSEQCLRGSQVPLRVLGVLTDVYVGRLVKRSRQRLLLSEHPRKIFGGKVICGKLSCGKKERRGRVDVRWSKVMWGEMRWCEARLSDVRRDEVRWGEVRERKEAVIWWNDRLRPR